MRKRYSTRSGLLKAACGCIACACSSAGRPAASDPPSDTSSRDDAASPTSVPDAHFDAAVDALSTVLAATPPMGWSTWNAYGCTIAENIVRDAADAIVSSGMRDAGYQYVNVDDCWQLTRDAKGNIVADGSVFPS